MTLNLVSSRTPPGSWYSLTGPAVRRGWEEARDAGSPIQRDWAALLLTRNYSVNDNQCNDNLLRLATVIICRQNFPNLFMYTISNLTAQFRPGVDHCRASNVKIYLHTLATEFLQS